MSEEKRFRFKPESRQRLPECSGVMDFIEAECRPARPGELTRFHIFVRRYKGFAKAKGLRFGSRYKIIKQLLAVGLKSVDDGEVRPCFSNVALRVPSTSPSLHPDWLYPLRFDEFVIDKLEVGPGLTVLSADLLASYSDWADRYSHPLTVSRLSRLVERRGFARWRDPAGRRGFVGLALLEAPRPTLVLKIEAWLAARCRRNDHAFCVTSNLHRDFLAWSGLGERGCSVKAFTAALRARGFVRSREPKTRRRGLSGIYLAPQGTVPNSRSDEKGVGTVDTLGDLRKASTVFEAAMGSGRTEPSRQSSQVETT